MGGNKYESTAYAPGELAPPPVTVEQRERDDPLTVVVKMPLMMSGYLGLAAGAFALLVALLAKSIWPGLPWQVIAFSPPILGLVTFTALFLTVGWQRMLYAFETRYKVDANRDRIIGDPQSQKPTEPHKIDVTYNGGAGQTGGDWLTFPFGAAETQVFLQAALDGNTTVAHMRSLKLRDRDVDAAREELFDLGYAEWVSERDHKQGWRLRAKGRAVISGYLDKYRPTLP